MKSLDFANHRFFAAVKASLPTQRYSNNGFCAVRFIKHFVSNCLIDGRLKH